MRSQRTNPRFFEDLSKMAMGAFGSFGDLRQQVKTLVRERIEQMMEDMEMVSRSEFDRVEAMAQKARERQEELEKRLAALEKQPRTTKKQKTAKKEKPSKRKTRK